VRTITTAMGTVTTEMGTLSEISPENWLDYKNLTCFAWTGAILVTRAVISGIIRNKQYMVLAHRIDCWILGESDTEGIVQRFATTSLQKIKMWWMSPQYIYHTYLCLGL